MSTGTVYTDSCDVLLSATGVLNEWNWPEIPGLENFKGKLMHSANWDESYDYKVRCYSLSASLLTQRFKESYCRGHRIWIKRHTDRSRHSKISEASR